MIKASSINLEPLRTTYICTGFPLYLPNAHARELCTKFQSHNTYFVSQHEQAAAAFGRFLQTNFSYEPPVVGNSPAQVTKQVIARAVQQNVQQWCFVDFSFFFQR